MKTRIALCLLLLSAPAYAAPRSLAGTLPDGSRYAISVPEAWNGTLLVWSHGYARATRGDPALAPPGLAATLLGAGYALAANAYAAPGWALASAVPDQIATIGVFEAAVGRPHQVLAWGASMGGLVTLALAEQKPSPIAGALALCGSVGGAVGMLNLALDGAFAFDTLIAPGSIGLSPPSDDRANQQAAAQALQRAGATAAGRARIALASALGGLPRWTSPGSARPAADDAAGAAAEAARAFVPGVLLPRADMQRLAGGQFSWNTGIDYRAQLAASGREAEIAALYHAAGLDLEADLARLDAAPRIAADPQAVAYMKAHYTPTGRLQVPLLTLHTIGDGMTSPTLEQGLAALVAAQGKGARLAEAFSDRAGHCSFSPAEELAALHALERRLADGSWHTAPADLNRPGADTRFIAYTPRPFLRPCAADAVCAGETTPAAPAFSRRSLYVPADDGTRLAVDLYRPAGLAAARTPVLLISGKSPRPRDPADLARFGVLALLRAGYSVAWMEERGIGASFGHTGGFLTRRDGRDAANLIEFLARQDFSDGRVAMFGISNMGLIQWLAAVERPPHLVAIAPGVANPDFYSQLYPNGVSALGGAPGIARGGHPIHYPPPRPPEPVDADPSGALLASAVAEHKGNISLGQEWRVNMTRDQVNPLLGYAPGMAESVLPGFIDRVRADHLAIDQMGGWYDASPGGQLAAFAAFGGHILIGAWPHDFPDDPAGGPIMRAELVRFFDDVFHHHGADLASRPPIRYQLIDAAAGNPWYDAASFPPPATRVRAFHLDQTRSGTAPSANDATLSAAAPATRSATPFRVDPGLVAFDGNFDRLNRRWAGDMAPGTDRHGLTWTSGAFSDPLEITGTPVLHLWLRANAPDTDCLVYLEAVDQGGRSRFITDGVMRASVRATSSEEPFLPAGIPFHDARASDAQRLVAGRAVRLDFALNPIAIRLAPGTRLRLTLTGSEANTYQLPPGFDPAHPTLETILAGGTTDSVLDLPIVPPGGHGYRDQAGRVALVGPGTLYLSDRAGNFARCTRDAASATCAGHAAQLTIDGTARLTLAGPGGFSGTGF